jgi:hypothetical protein
MLEIDLISVIRSLEEERVEENCAWKRYKKLKLNSMAFSPQANYTD